MSYSSLIQSVPEVWRSSTGLAALASLGIHGLVLVSLPFISLNSPDDQLPQTVGIVALTPEEQSRLPQVVPQGVTQTTIPPTTLQSDLPALPPSGQAVGSEILPPLPPTPSYLPPPPPINTPTYQYPISNSLPSSQVPTPIPLPPPPENRSFSQDPFSQLPPPQPNQTIKNQQLAPPNPVPPGTLPSTTGLKKSEFATANKPNLTPPNTNQTQNQATNNRTNQQPLTPAALPERAKQELIARRNAIIRERAANKISPNSNQRLAAVLQRRRQAASDRTSSNSNQRLAAVLQRRQTASSNQRLAAVLQRRQQQQNGSTPNQLSRATRQTIAQIDAFKEQQQRTLQAFPTAAIQRPIRYKIKTCNKQLDGGVAILAAVVNPKGKIVSGPDLLSKNSSAAVGQAAKSFVKEYSFPKTANLVNQPFRLDFSYDFKSCPVTNKTPRSNS